ncbi:L,D-transpeptidase family protein [Novosphingobium sp. TH158]|uniref:L,D-transpeptidase family protein n=1 Tax=Novosphingobium sp. TH158 TaxID=2067455 RepID=UPI000C7AB1C5|nr:L,D-transpeptidase family protein [Novosphingobium sp. TH158]PLK26026.1 hypothetical protein C0V78_03345 [Novosphingobium sp. TH158]
MRRLVLPVVLFLSACNQPDSDPASRSSTGASASPTVDPLASRDGTPDAFPDSQARPLMQAQVVLDRLGFSPGVIDGKEGLSTRNALAGFQEANGLPVTGTFDPATWEVLGRWQVIPATRVVTIPEDFARGPFAEVPDDPADQAAMPALGYASLDEKLAERFHTSVETLVTLNPGGFPAGSPEAEAAIASAKPAPAASQSPSGEATAHFRAGQQIRVPNIGNDRVDPASVDDAGWLLSLVMLGIGSTQPRVERVIVSKAKGTLKAFDAGGQLVAAFTVTTGSRHDPLPLGQWKVNGIARNPKFHYNPDLFWDASPGDEKAMLPPGPNSPVGIVWIDLSKPHYGIHGTPEPRSIGRAESHGCVRLTNWDAARLAQMVGPGTRVDFVA